MSNRRRPGRHPWKPWTDHTPAHQRLTQTVQPGGRITVVAQGADAGAIAAIEAFRRAGAVDVTCGYDPPPGYAQDVDVPPGIAVTWWFRVTYPNGHTAEGRYGPTTDHAYGALEAAAQILRRGGATVDIHQREAN